jgi:alkylation response protein AidB-like acyl-CoA dehydrogenase
LRFPSRWGGRALNWSYEVLALEEIGVLGASLACLYSLPSIVGEAIHCFGTDEQKERYLGSIIAGRMTVAEALTEPRGGSDFFGATATAVTKAMFISSMVKSVSSSVRRVLTCSWFMPVPIRM